MYQETKSLDRASRHAVLSREADYVRFFEDKRFLGDEVPDGLIEFILRGLGAAREGPR